MRSTTITAVFALSLSLGPTFAGSLDWANEDQIRIAGQIGSALANANVCNFEVDTDRLSAIIRDKIAVRGTLTPEMAASLMSLTVGVQAMQTQLLQMGATKKPRLQQHCATIIAAFGPRGSELVGILKP